MSAMREVPGVSAQARQRPKPRPLLPLLLFAPPLPEAVPDQTSATMTHCKLYAPASAAPCSTTYCYSYHIWNNEHIAELQNLRKHCRISDEQHNKLCYVRNSCALKHAPRVMESFCCQLRQSLYLSFFLWVRCRTGYLAEGCSTAHIS